MPDKKLKILFVSSEVAPFAKTGGLADVAGALPRALSRLGHEVRVFLPYYRMVKKGGGKTKTVLPAVPVAISDRLEKSAVRQIQQDGVTFYFLQHDEYYDRDNLYGTDQGDYPDNAERFMYFCRAVLESLKPLEYRPDIIHCNDWQTGLIPVYLKSLYKDDNFFSRTANLFTIHNLAYQGVFWHWDIHLTGLGWDYFVPEWIEFYGKINLMKAGILHAGAVTTVSKKYAREIQTPEFGCGLEDVLRARKHVLHGIVNGIDYQLFNPANDRYIAQVYDSTCPDKKAVNKKALRKYYGLSAKNAPLIGIVSRLADQKGFDLLAEAMDGLLKMGFQLAVLGTGDIKYHKLLKKIAGKNPRQVGVKLVYDVKLAQLIYAGSDLFLMPSRYEPCGLGQLISLRYGTIPLVRYTGGLADTVKEFNLKTKQGTGFGFREYKSKALLIAAEKALTVYMDTLLWQSLLQNAFAADFSWDHSAQEYVALYQQIRCKRLGLRQAKQCL